MNKQEFLAVIKNEIAVLPQEDIERSLDYYGEMVDERIEDGMPEEQAVAEMGTIDEIVSQILEDIPMQTLVKTKVKNPSRSLRVWEIVLLVLGSPLWLSLIIAAFAVVLSVYITVWAVVVTLYAAVLSVALGGVAGVLGIIVLLFTHGLTSCLMFLGAGLICSAVAIPFFIGVNYIAKGVVHITKLIFRGIKRCLIRKGNRK